MTIRANKRKRTINCHDCNIEKGGAEHHVFNGYCDAHGIEVASVPGYAANTVAEHSLAMIMELFRRLHGAPCSRLTRDMSQEGWVLQTKN
ncbi:hypothetical protein [Pseudomonas capeferrum]|uniref:hypothetical protein n=1 Tax=Pseudomonas capeferrum TaxID=1495066 RepID=UPI002159B3F8|nr:hypothetical protein [Pseudomonas capeferrum]